MRRFLNAVHRCGLWGITRLSISGTRTDVRRIRRGIILNSTSLRCVVSLTLRVDR